MLTILKIDTPRQMAYGYASVVLRDGAQVIDHQGDVIDVGHLESAAHAFMSRYRASGLMHTGASVATVVESVVLTAEKCLAMGMPEDVARSLDGRWWIGIQINDPAVFARVRSGELKAFSIQGRGTRRPREA